MFDFFRKHTRVLQFILVLLIFPSFVFLGVSGYTDSMGGANGTVATVDGRPITRAEWEAAQRDQIERVRRQRPDVDPKLFDSPEMQRQSLDALVRERVMLAAADRLKLVTTDDRLQRLFATDPQFAFLRNPDGSVKQATLSGQGMSSDLFAQRLRQDLTLRQVLLGLSGTVVAPAAVTSAALDAMLQQREVQVQRFNTSDSLAKVVPSDADIEKFYNDPANAAQFAAPEQASVEYVVLDLEALQKGLVVSDDDLRKHYAENAARFTTPEERRASHILIKAEKDSPADVRQQARARAEALLAELRASPSSFAEVATKNSADSGSAQKGGDLDFFGRGAMVKPFEDAAFSLKPGELSGVVESDFGYHVILLTEVRGGQTRSFESVRPELEAEVKTQLAQKRFAEVAVEFTNTVYEQPDSLKPAADKFKLELRTARNVTRVPAAGATGPLANPKLLAALFAGDVVRNKRNTEAVEVAPSRLVSGRIVEYTAARQLPLADVKAKVREKLAVLQAAALARQLGEARLAAARAAPDAAFAEPAQVVSRAQTRDLPRAVIDAVLKAPATTLPAVVGINLGDDGYAVVRLTKVLGRDPVAADAAQAQAQYAQTWSDAELQAYYSALKSRFKVDIDDTAVALVDPAASSAGR